MTDDKSNIKSEIRRSTVSRTTGETDIFIAFQIEGKGNYELFTEVPFFEHMLAAFTKHSLFDLTVKAKGDLEVDAHHLVEDIGIVLGLAIKEALGDKLGITRFADATVPMDEALVMVAIDVSGRGQLHWHVDLPIEFIGNFDTTLYKEFLLAVCSNAGITMHVKSLYGENSHHIIEAVSKAVGIALSRALSIDERKSGTVASTKGVI